MKYNTEILDSIKKHLEDGLTSKDVCHIVNISEETYYKWKREKTEFSELVKKGKATFKANLIKTIGKASEKDWKASAWLLEHRYPKEFSLKHIEQELSEDATEIDNEQRDRINRFLLQTDGKVTTENFTQEEKEKVSSFLEWLRETQKVREKKGS